MISQAIPLTTHFPTASRLAYGCMGLGSAPRSVDAIKQAENILDTCVQLGINVFDHADIYTNGSAEQAFGKALQNHPHLREQIIIQSKCGIRFADDLGPKRYDLSADWILSSVEGSLRRLNSAYLDILLLHRPDPLMEAEEVAQAFEQLHQSGKVRHFGVSNMHGPQIAYLQQHLDMPLICNQVEISLAKRDWLEEGVLAGHTAGKDVNFTADTVEYCRRNKVQIQSWGSLCRGLYSGQEVSNEPISVQQTAARVMFLASEYQATPEAIVLAWLMRHPARVQPVIGTTNCARIKACQQATSLQLSREHWYQLFVDARGHKVP